MMEDTVKTTSSKKDAPENAPTYTCFDGTDLSFQMNLGGGGVNNSVPEHYKVRRVRDCLKVVWVI